MIMDGLVEKGMVTASFMVHGRGRPKKVYKLAEEMRIPLRKVVGLEEEFIYLLNIVQEEKRQGNQGVYFTQERRADFSQNNNSLFERAMGGGWKWEQEKESSREKSGVCYGIEGGMVGFVLNMGSSFSLGWRRTSFDFCDGFSIGLGGIEEGRGDCNDLVELWEEGLIDF